MSIYGDSYIYPAGSGAARTLGSRPFAGAVLTGGASRRMGRDKALVEVRGRVLAVIAADALREADAEPVIAVGGDERGLARRGLAVIADDHPGDGPLGALLTAFRHTGAQVVVVLACDLPRAAPAAVLAVVEALASEDADAAVVTAGGRYQWLFGAWRRERCLGVLGDAFTAGERAVHRAALSLAVLAVAIADPSAVTDVDTPSELARHRPPVEPSANLRQTGP